MIARSTGMSSLSPERQEGDASDGHDRRGISPVNLDILKSLTEKKTTREGNPPKKRGPKPDSKPALTRRQELNRQAQRTHRERKEIYIKALEDEVLRLKEIFSSVTQDKDKLADENRQLRDALVRHRIPVESVALSLGGSNTYSSRTPNSQTAMSPPLTAQSTLPSTGSSYGSPPRGQHAMTGLQPQGIARYASNQGNSNVDFEQAGIDFVLTLERPCMAHMSFLLERAADVGGEPCGHALMASCPPQPFPNLPPDTPFGTMNISGEDTMGQQTWELTKADLSTLLHLSKRLNLDGEITPVMAWGTVMAHPNFHSMTPEDFQRLAGELGRKIRCYGFGAVMEEFEVRDAIENVITSKCDSKIK